MTADGTWDGPKGGTHVMNIIQSQEKGGKQMTVQLPKEMVDSIMIDRDMYKRRRLTRSERKVIGYIREFENQPLTNKYYVEHHIRKLK